MAFAGHEDPDGRVERHRVDQGRERWAVADRDGTDAAGLPRYRRRVFGRRDFGDGSSSWLEFHEEVA